jgi:hypothetical protein
MDDEPGTFKLRHPGGRRVKGERGLYSTLKWGSSSADYILARLERDANEGVEIAATLLAGVLTRRISAYAAGVEYGICKRREPRGGGSENMTKLCAWKMHKVLYPRPTPKPK